MSKTKTIENCKIEGCQNNRRYSNGLCPKHYRRLKTHGDPLWEPEAKRITCKVLGCERPHFSNGYCRSHDGQVRFHGKILEGSSFKELSICSISGCKSVSIASNMCSKHYSNYKKYGNAEHVRENVTGIKEYEVWCGMIARCHNINHKSYKYYGGRGIYVCEQWRNSFEIFYDDMGQRPTKYHQIDRIDNDMGYEPANCEWVTSKVNNSHKSNSVVTKEFIAYVKTLKDLGMKQKDIVEKTGKTRSSVQRAFVMINMD